MNINADLNSLVININSFIWGWPLVIFGLTMATITTVYLGFVQFRYFFRAWKYALCPSKVEAGNQADMTPFQAFLNALSSSLGNGSIAGMATAITAGGPGAALWVFIFGLLSMSLRYAEIYLSAIFGVKQSPSGIIGGPMVYLSKVPGGKVLPYLFAVFCFFLSLTGGNAMQANSIRLGLVRILDVNPLVVALVLLAFMLYVMLGGAQRIISVSSAIVPVKVGVFFASALIVLGYHYAAIIPALILIIKSGLSSQAFAGGLAGYSIQQAMRFGMSRSLNASEAGLGVAAVMFGGSNSKTPVKDSIMGMLSTFISANLVCFMVMLIIISSGVWNNGQESINLTISAYETVFGTLGGWIVTFLTLSFGLGVLVAYAYVGRVCWLFFTGGRYLLLFNLIFCSVTFLGALANVSLVWNSIDLFNGCLLVINLFGILMLLPVIKKGLIDFQNSEK